MPTHTDIGQRIYSFISVSTLLSTLKCPKCLCGPLELHEQPLTTGSIGLHSTLLVKCLECKLFVSKSRTCKTIEPGRMSMIGLRAVASARNVGVGFQQLVRLLAGMNIPKPMHVKTYQTIAKQVWRASNRALQVCYQKAASQIRSHYMAKDPTLTDDSVIDITIGYDGTWHRRGYSSHHGVGSAIDLETGLVIDSEVLCNYCHGCKSKPKPDDPALQTWLENHSSSCQRNHDGSSASMELAAARAICERSIDKYKLRYSNILCDGDAKTVIALNEAKIYDQQIQKEDCVNHVTKRLYNGIEALKTKSRGTINHLSGKGRITKKLQRQLSVSYGQAIKNGAPDVLEMEREVKATLYHRMSTDEVPRHEFCPTGEDSWCKFQVESAKGIINNQRSYIHKTPIQPAYGKQLIPLYERLSNPGNIYIYIYISASS